MQTGAEKQERWSHIIEMKVLQALAHHMLGEKQEAQTHLAQAVDLAEPEGYIRVFVDEGTPMADLLSLLRKQQHTPGLTAYLDTLLLAFRQESQEQKRPLEKARQRATVQPLLDPLSKRELELLQLVAQGASNPEIAEELVLSVDTVKHHVYNIYSKLGVKNRIKALARAHDLGLISEGP
jgi:LuxR family maltose regulon positive regulatory protein